MIPTLITIIYMMTVFAIGVWARKRMKDWSFLRCMLSGAVIGIYVGLCSLGIGALGHPNWYVVGGMLIFAFGFDVGQQHRRNYPDGMFIWEQEEP